MPVASAICHSWCSPLIAEQCDNAKCAQCAHCKRLTLCRHQGAQTKDCLCSTAGRCIGQAIGYSAALPVLNSDFCLLPALARRPLNASGDRIAMQMERYKIGRTFGLIENKLAHSLLRSFGMPVLPVIYGAFAKSPLGRWPKYEREAFVAALRGRTTNFVMKPATDGQSNNVLVMSKAKWHRDGWSVQRLADFAERILFSGAAAPQWEQVHEHRGLVVQESALDVDGYSAARPLVVEATLHAVWGRLSSGALTCVPHVKRVVGHRAGGAPITHWGCIDESLLHQVQVFFDECGELRFAPAEQSASRHAQLMRRASRRLAALARNLSAHLGADWFRLDAFVAERPSRAAPPVLHINEITYPSNFQVDSPLDLHRLERPYRTQNFQPVAVDRLLPPLLQRVGLTTDDL